MDVKYLYMMNNTRLCRLNLSELEQKTENPPSLELVFDFHEANLPIGMGLFTLEDNGSTKLYACGGEKHNGSKEDLASFDWFKYRFGLGMRFLDQSYGDDGGLERKVYSLEPNRDGHKTSIGVPIFVPVESSTVPPMNSPKTNVLTVEVADGKVYALSLAPYLFDEQRRPFPSFEVYDPATKAWSVLPDPPFTPLHFCPAFPYNGSIVAFDSHETWLYDAVRQEWVEDTSLPRYIYDSPSGAVAIYQDFTIADTDRGVTVYFPLHSVEPQHQVLDELRVFEYDAEDFFDSPLLSLGHIFHLGGGKMCYVCFIDEHVYEHAVVTIFQLKVDRQGSKYHASTCVLCQHVYTVNGLLPFPDVIRHVFVMSEQSKKHKLPHELPHESSKRPQISPYCAQPESKACMYGYPGKLVRFRNKLCRCGNRAIIYR